MKIKNTADLKKIKERGIESIFLKKPRFRIGEASCGLGAGAEATKKVMKDVRVPESIGRLSITGCIGACYAEPLVELYVPKHGKILFKNVDSERGEEIMKAACQGRVKEEYAFCKIDEEYSLITDERKGLDTFPSFVDLQTQFRENYLDKIFKSLPSLDELEYFSGQKKIVLRNSGHINPENIDEYIGRDGYLALYESLQMGPGSIIEEVSKSKLRGRGGAGYPTGEKWRLAREAGGETKYVVSNGDEGDPGAYMDRVVLESDPHSMIEGMIIGAYAIGADEGFIFVRNEYPKAVERLELAVEQARDYGLLGDDIMNSGFSFDVDINRGGGAFVCGEETALMSAIEGNMPNPRPRPPYPTETGLWGKPTLINNVKTWANIPVIISRGGKYLSEMGTKRSGGTKVFSLVGDVRRRGLIEVNLGTSLEEIVIDIGNTNKEEIKAVQTGGPSGGFVPAKHLDIPLDYEALTELGSIMGSGGLVVSDKNTCMIDMANYFLEFTLSESCGQCTPCREGLERMRNILVDITEGEAVMEDLTLLRELASYVEEASLCGLGKTAPRPVLTTLDHFEEEYREHVEEKTCRAGVCSLGNEGEENGKNKTGN